MNNKVLLQLMLVSAFSVQSQVPVQKIDSLNAIVRNVKSSELDKSMAYLGMAEFYSHSHPDSILRNCYLSLRHLRGQKENKINRRIKAKAYSNLGLAFSIQGKLVDALSFHLKAKVLWEKLEDPLGLAICYNNIAVINKQALNFQEAEKRFKNAWNWAVKSKDKNTQAMIHNNLGNLYKEQNKDVFALNHYMLSKKIREKLNEPDGMAATLNNIGSLYQKQNKFELAINYYLQAESLVKKTNNMRGIAHSSLNLANTYIKSGDFDRAEKYGLQALNNAKHIKASTIIAESAETLSKVYENNQDWKNAVAMHQLYMQYSDPGRLEDLSRELIKSEFEFDFEKHRQELKIQHAQKLIKSNEQKQKQVLITIFISVLMIILLVFSVLLYKRIIRLNAQNKLIDKQNNERKLLLQEIHHRVKNNFQIISSMLRLQSRNQKNEEVNDAFNEAINRLHAMSFVHEIIYKHSSFEEIELSEYLEKLMGSIKKSFPENLVEISFNGVNEKLNIDRAIPIGIILNELITNSFKHAFPEFKDDARIHIEMERIDSKLVLNYQDNGVGYDTGKVEHSFGTELINTIVDQLTGKIIYSKDFYWSTQVNLSFEAPILVSRKVL